MRMSPKICVAGVACLLAPFLAAPAIAGTVGDYDGDGKADKAVWRPSSGTWYIIPSSAPTTFTATQWGVNGDIPVPGDYDGDGKTDMAVWRPSTGTWYILPSSKPGTFTATQWGVTGDIPVPGDYDGDGKTDMAVWRPSTGTWYILPSSKPGTFIALQWGVTGDIPVPGDYDGDGKTDTAVWRPSTGTWYVIPSSAPTTFTATQWGVNGDIPVPGDYDGDKKTDKAVWRPSSGTWYIIPSSAPTTFTATQWGVNGDIPVPADYDGDGKTDMAVWRPSSGTWYIIPSSAPTTFTATQWGISGDAPVQEPVAQFRTGPPAIVSSDTTLQNPAFAGDAPTAIPITVANDVAGDMVTVTLTTDSNTGLACTTATCGSFNGSLSTTATGTSGGGSYSVTYTPPPAAGFTTQTAPALTVHSSLNPTSPNPFDASDSMEIDPAGAHRVVLGVSPGLGIVQTASAVRTLTATVLNDMAGLGVRFVVLTASGYACTNIGANSCGTLGTPSAPLVSGTMSTTTVTYTPPATLPSAPYDRPQIEAISNADKTQFASATFQLSGTAPPANTGLGISRGEKINSALAGSSAPIIVDANIGNDTGNSRTVTWTLTSGGPPPTGVNCSPQCGTLGTPTPSGNGSFVSSEITYTPPGTYPGVTADQTPTITATSVDNPAATDSFTFTIADEVCGTGHESVLNGQYAFLLRGGGANAGYGALIGSFTADGAGHITGGLLDLNTSTSGPSLGDTIQAAGSSYTVGSDNRVCMTLTDPIAGVFNFRAALGTLVSNVATQGRIILFNDNNGRRLKLSGVLMKQTPPFAASQVSGNYVLGLSGVDGSGGRLTGAGVLTTDGAGHITNYAADFNDAGTVSGNATGGTGTYTVASTSRGTATTTITILGKPTTTNDVLYMVSSSEILSMSSDSFLSNNAITTAELKKQTGPFLATTLDSKDYVFHVEGVDGSNGGNDTVIGQATFTTSGNANLTIDENDNGTLKPEQTGASLFTITGNGRTTLSGAAAGNHPPVLYLIDSSSAFIVGTGGSAEFGIVDQQVGGPFSTASISGPFFFGGDAPVPARSYESGTVNADGVGNVTGSGDKSGPNGLGKDTISPATGGTYSFSNTSTPQGKGTVGTNIAYVISGSKLIFMSQGSDAGFTIIQK